EQHPVPPGQTIGCPGAHHQGQRDQLHARLSRLALQIARRRATGAGPGGTGSWRMRTSFIETLCALAEQDQRIWVLTGDLGYSVLEPFVRAFPDRYVNVGVAEQNMAGIAAGLARCGKIPFTYSIANFPTLRCLEQIRNDICYHEGDVKIVAVGGGFTYGPQG